MFPRTHKASQPPRVTGPRHSTPWARRHFAESIRTSWTRFRSFRRSFSGFVLFSSHSWHRARVPARTEPFGGGVPARRAWTAFARSCGGGGGGSAGRVVVRAPLRFRALGGGRRGGGSGGPLGPLDAPGRGDGRRLLRPG